MNTKKRMIGTAAIVAAGLCLLAEGWSSEASIDALRAAVADGDWAQAEILGRQQASADPTEAEGRYLLGKALLEQGKLTEAVAELERACQLDGEEAEHFARLGYALILRGQEMDMFQAGPVYMKALDQYKKAVALDPDHLEAQIGLSRYYWNAPPIGGGSLRKAKEHAAEVLRLDPYLGYFEQAMIARKEGDAEGAVSLLEKALGEHESAEARFELGATLERSGATEAARAAYLRALELEPEHAGSQAALARLALAE